MVISCQFMLSDVTITHNTLVFRRTNWNSVQLHVFTTYIIIQKMCLLIVLINYSERFVFRFALTVQKLCYGITYSRRVLKLAFSAKSIYTTFRQVRENYIYIWSARRCRRSRRGFEPHSVQWYFIFLPKHFFLKYLHQYWSRAGILCWSLFKS